MARYVTLEGLPQDLYNSFKADVEPMDVLAGAMVDKVFTPKVQKMFFDAKDGFLKGMVAPGGIFSDTKEDNTPNKYGPYLQKALVAAVLAGGLYFAQKGNKRAKGHVVGVLGYALVDVVGQEVYNMLPTTFQRYNGMGILTQDDAYGILTADSAYGEPTHQDMARFQAETAHLTEGEPEAEYA